MSKTLSILDQFYEKERKVTRTLQSLCPFDSNAIYPCNEIRLRYLQLKKYNIQINQNVTEEERSILIRAIECEIAIIESSRFDDCRQIMLEFQQNVATVKKYVENICEQIRDFFMKMEIITIDELLWKELAELIPDIEDFGDILLIFVPKTREYFGRESICMETSLLATIYCAPINFMKYMFSPVFKILGEHISPIDNDYPLYFIDNVYDLEIMVHACADSEYSFYLFP